MPTRNCRPADPPVDHNVEPGKHHAGAPRSGSRGDHGSGGSVRSPPAPPRPGPPRTRSPRAGGAPRAHQAAPPTAGTTRCVPLLAPFPPRPAHRLLPPQKIITGGWHQGVPSVTAHDPFQRRDPRNQPRVRRRQLSRVRACCSSSTRTACSTVWVTRASSTAGSRSSPVVRIPERTRQASTRPCAAAMTDRFRQSRRTCPVDQHHTGA